MTPDASATETLPQFRNARANPKGPGLASPLLKGGKYEGHFKGRNSLGELKIPPAPLYKKGEIRGAF
jgi:hypothetical protein